MTENKKTEADPLIQALPPATDYLTYLTLIEYQLTPARLPILHQVLQDETLTTNIGWDLVHLLLPFLPASQECLDDVARLGNPREVILRVSDSLMKLEATEEEEEDEEDDDRIEGRADNAGSSCSQKLPLHILQFNTLLSMLSVLHSRIKTRFPSRFVATSLQAALEAYTEFPSAETTAAMLEFLRDLSGKKRPALPPRNLSEQLIARSTETPAPDPEADSEAKDSDDTTSTKSTEPELIHRLMQFGLVEVLKTYILHCTDDPLPGGMLWAVRLLEKLHPGQTLDPTGSFTNEFESVERLKERDRTVGKIVALSKDFGLETDIVINSILTCQEDHPPPLDFDHVPESAADIPLERHGCVLLLAARSLNTALFGSGALEKNINLYPDIVNILTNFFDSASADTAVAEEPESFIDAILSLAEIAYSNEQGYAKSPNNESSFKNLVLVLTACSRGPPNLKAISRIESIPAKIFHAYPDPQVRFNLIKEIFEKEELQYAKIPALQWLKSELLAADSTQSETENEKNKKDRDVFLDHKSISTLLYRVYTHDTLSDSSNFLNLDINTSTWMRFIQELAPLYLAQLNLYYFLCISSSLSSKLQIPSLHLSFCSKYLSPLKSFVEQLCWDTNVSAQIEMDAGEAVMQMGKSAAHVVMHLIREVEDAISS